MIFRRLRASLPLYAAAALFITLYSCAQPMTGNKVLLKDGVGGSASSGEDKEYDYLMQRGALFENAGDLTNALDYYKRASVLRPGSPEPYFGMGNAYLKGRMLPKAEASFLKAIELNPNVGIYHNNLAWTYIEMGLPVTAKDYATRGSYMDFPRRYIYMDTLGYIELKLGNFKLAEINFRDAAMAVPTTDLAAQYKIYSHIRDLFVAIGDKNKAAKAEEKLNNIRMGIFAIYDF